MNIFCLFFHLILVLMSFYCNSASHDYKALHSNSYSNPQSYFKFVLSGGSGVGKSTIIDHLEKRGSQITPEVWTLLHREAQQEDCLESFYASSASSDFRKTLMDIQQAFEQSLNSTSAFLDRSTVDVVAFGHYYNIKMPASLIKLIKHQNYDLIFFPDHLPEELYKEKLTCTRQESVAMHTYLKNFYKSLGYNTIDVPFATPDERVDFIMSKVTEYLSQRKS